MLYKYRYGTNPCAAHDEQGLNLYKPIDQVKTFAIHTASLKGAGSNQKSCQGAFDIAFRADTLLEDYEVNSTAVKNINELVGYRHGEGAVTAIGTLEDKYEVLAKAIGLYNSNPGRWFRNLTWPYILKNMGKGLPGGKNDAEKNKCASCEYTIEIRNGHLNNSSFGLPHRTYIWAGERQPALLTDGSVNPQAGEPVWCFAFGEKEWMGGKKFTEINLGARGNLALGISPVGRVNCSTGVLLP